MNHQKKDAKELLGEYFVKENEALDEICCKFEKRAVKGNCEMSPLDFYPELNLREPYTSWQWGYPVWVLLPYFDNIIIHIYPSHSEREFKRDYGIGVDELLDLQKEGRVSLILTHPQELELSDYFFPLYQEGIEKGFPSLLRIVGFMDFVGQSDFKEGEEEGRSLFEGKFVHNHGKSISDLEKYPHNCRRWLCPICNQYPATAHKIANRLWSLEKFSILDYSYLRGFGFHQICEGIKTIAMSNPAKASYVAGKYRNFLVNPTIFSLDGIHLVDKEDILSLKDYMELDLDLSVTKANYEVFPFEIGKSLIEKANLVVPNSLDNSLDIYPDFEEARKALKNLETAVEERKEDLGDEIAALKETWEAIDSMNAKVDKGAKLLTSLGIVGSAAGGYSLWGFPGLLATLTGSFLSTNFIAEPLSEKLSKIGKSSNIVAVYDFVRNRR